MEDNRKIWLNGKIVELKDATINVLAPTSQFGANVFEGIRCYWNDEENQLYAFRLHDHFRRLQQSCRLFQIECPFSEDQLKSFLIDTVAANNYQEDIAVRQTIFVDGFGSWFSQEPLGMFISPVTKKRKKNPLDHAERTCISSWERISERNMSPRIKVGANYINSRLAKLEAARNGYDSALFLNNQGFVSEGTGSCFFMIKDQQLVTPAQTDSILESITRDTVINIAEKILNLKVVERCINRTEVYCADEAFFCGSAVEISPVAEIDGYVLSDGMPGPITNALHQQYLEIVTGRNNKYREWITPVYKS